MKILVICTGNSCRSPMAAAFLQSLDTRLEVSSAGTKPESSVNPFAVKATHEMLLDISTHKPSLLQHYQLDGYDRLIVLCENAMQQIKEQEQTKAVVHFIPLPDPAAATGNDAYVLEAYRNCRDEIKNEIFKLYIKHIKPNLK